MHITKCGETLIAYAIRGDLGFRRYLNYSYFRSEPALRAVKISDMNHEIYSEEILLYAMSQTK